MSTENAQQPNNDLSAGSAKLPVSRRSFLDDVKSNLIEILGKNAYSNSFKVSDDVSRLCHTVQYLAGQLNIIKNDVDEDAKEYIDSVVKSAAELLSKNGG